MAIAWTRALAFRIPRPRPPLLPRPPSPRILILRTAAFQGYGRPYSQHDNAQTQPSRKPWTADEVTTLKRLRDHGAARKGFHHAFPDRTYASLLSKLHRLNTCPPNRPPNWTVEEDQLLRQGKRDHLPMRQIVPLLPRRSYASVRNRWYCYIKPNEAADITTTSLAHGSYRPWSDDDTDTLFRMRKDGVPTRNIATLLGRRVTDCESKWARSSRRDPEGLKNAVRWSHSKLDALRVFAVDGLSFRDMANRLTKSYSAVKSKYLGMKHNGELPILDIHARRHWSEAEDRQLIHGRHAGLSYQEVASTLPGRTVRAVRARLVRLVEADKREQRPYKRALGEGAGGLQK